LPKDVLVDIDRHFRPRVPVVRIAGAANRFDKNFEMPNGRRMRYFLKDEKGFFISLNPLNVLLKHLPIFRPFKRGADFVCSKLFI